ncbi:MAG: YqgE/AlgH family protein [Planctomycetota bacterium]|nr:MAG: YqgE/AlgH family protein [Planctomycetota bacterium]
MTEPLDPAPGRVLVAVPSLVDPNFEESAVLLCRHHPEEGAVGLILNRPLGLPLRQLLPDAAGAGDLDLCWGGPVGLERLHALHGGGPDLAESIEVCAGVAFGGTIEDLLRLRTEGRPVRVFLGYSGWEGGQLERELAEGTWLVHPGGAEAAFDPDPATQWQRLAAAIDPTLAWLRHRPEDPERN